MVEDSEFISLEQVSFIVRHHPDGKGFGSPYDFSCVVVVKNETDCILKAGVGKFSKSTGSKISEVLYELGFRNLEFERKEKEKKE